MHVLPLTLDLHSTPLSRTVFSDCFCMEHDLKKQEKNPESCYVQSILWAGLLKQMLYFMTDNFQKHLLLPINKKNALLDFENDFQSASLKKKGKKITRFAPLLLQKLTFHSKGGAITKSLVCHYIFELRFYLTSVRVEYINGQSVSFNLQCEFVNILSLHLQICSVHFQKPSSALWSLKFSRTPFKWPVSNSLFPMVHRQVFCVVKTIVQLLCLH